MNVTDQMQQELQGLKERSNLRTLPALIHEGREVIAGGQRMLNLWGWLPTATCGKSFCKN